MTMKTRFSAWARRSGSLTHLVILVLLTGCAGDDFEAPSRSARVQEAEAAYQAERFDSISWSDAQRRSRHGNEVYASRCRSCHGTLGRGVTAYARERDLAVPSLVEPDWRYATSVDSVRHRIFVGHERGMPTWGIAGISPRDIDAVASYVLDVLRPEVLRDPPG